MSDPGNGPFAIISARQPNPRIGTTIRGSAPAPVISGGQDNVWIFRELSPGKYRVTLAKDIDQQWSATQGSRDSVVVNLETPAVWSIEAHGEYYSIQAVDDQGAAWTLSSVEPNSWVELRRFDASDENQLWRIVDLRQVPGPIPQDM